MPCPCGTVGDHHIYPPTASVASILPSNMHLAAQGADFLLFVTMRFENITADLLSGVCHSVGTEPSLQPVTGEQFEHRTANREDGARLDIVAQSFWGRDRQSAFFDVRVFNPFAPCYRSSTLAQCYRVREEEGIRRACEGNRTRFLLPTGFFSRRRYGPHCNCRVQETGLSLV